MKRSAEPCIYFPRGTKIIPYLVGEPGVGKTAIAEGMAHRIVNGDVPENLKIENYLCIGYGPADCGCKV